MSMHILITGTLYKPATPRTSQSGKEFTTANIRIEQDGQATWANVIAFDQQAQDELKRLDAGDVVSVQGKLKVSVYEKDGQARPSLDVTAYSVLPARPKPRPRKAAPGRPQAGSVDAGRDSGGFDDRLTF